MKLTPQQRRARIQEMVEADEEFQKMLREFEPAREEFEHLVDQFPLPLRNILWSYPGMGHFLYHRLLTVVSNEMQFKDETDEKTIG